MAPVASRVSRRRHWPCDVMQKVHINLVGRYPLSKKRFHYLLTAICGFTKYLICMPLWDKLSVSVADALMRHLYLMYNPLELLLHDQRGEFWSDMMKRLSNLLEIQPSKITQSPPELQRVVEHIHAMLHLMITKLVDQNQRKWDQLAPYVTYAYHACQLSF